jgi:hypothetical protein
VLTAQWWPESPWLIVLGTDDDAPGCSRGRAGALAVNFGVGFGPSKHAGRAGSSGGLGRVGRKVFGKQIRLGRRIGKRGLVGIEAQQP